MSADLLFQIANNSVLPAWLLLAVAPGWKYTQRAAFGVTIPLLAVLYSSLLISALTMGGDGEMPDFTTLDGVMALMGDRYGLVTAWVHYLAFDLFVGAWISRDARALGIPHLLILIPLFLTLMAGPLGLLLYLVLRQVRRRKALAEPLAFALPS